jgi:membrane-bound lytic murein transglycosylase B
MAIYGHETSYGAVTGDFDLANSLATLAYEGRRRQLFADEFIATLRLMDRGYPRSQLKGSWAGATGYPQFLPSMFLRLGVDGDGDGRSDIWRSQADALASIGNYLNNAGWKPRVPWGIRVAVPATLNRVAIGNATNSPRCPRVHDRHSRWLTMREWRALGVVPTGAAIFRHLNWPRCSNRRPERPRVSADHELPRDPGLQLLQLLRAVGWFARRRNRAMSMNTPA